MNIIKFEFLGSAAEVCDTSCCASPKVRFEFAGSADGYLSIGPRIIKLRSGIAEFSLELFADGIHGCYLMIAGERFDMPSLEKSGALFRMTKSSHSSDFARVNYLKSLEARIKMLEERLDPVEQKIYGQRSII